MPSNLLNPTSVASFKPAAKPYKKSDGEGLQLLVQTSGSKLWQFRYKVAGKDQVLSFGVYGERDGVTLEAARRLRDQARQLLRNGGDPAAVKREQKQQAEAAAGPRTDTFQHFSDQVLAQIRARMHPLTVAKWERYLRYCNAQFGPVPVADIRKADVLAFLQPWEAAGKNQTTHDLRRCMVRIFDLAGDAELIDSNPANFRARTFLPVQSTSHAALLEPKRFGELLAAIETYQGQPATRGCLQLSALTLLRSTEIRLAQWDEIDWEAKQWTIPAARMKTVAGRRYEHIVPLSAQALAILRQLEAVYGRGQYIFPSVRGDGRTLSENAVNAALRYMGFSKTEMTAHGFRSSATTIMLDAKLAWPRWIAEPSKVLQRQLAHLEPNETHRAYDKAKLLDARTWAMQAWADLCDRLRDPTSNVVPLVAEKAQAAESGKP